MAPVVGDLIGGNIFYAAIDYGFTSNISIHSLLPVDLKSFA
jgi:hypothetical protein